MIRFVSRLPNGKLFVFTKNHERSALKHIQKRIEYWMPIETVDVEEMKKVINGIHVVIAESATPEEVGTIINEMKAFLIGAIDKMPKHERYLCKKEGDERKE